MQANPSSMSLPRLQPQSVPGRDASPLVESPLTPQVAVEQQAEQAPRPMRADVLATMERELVERAQRDAAEGGRQPASGWPAVMEHVRTGELGLAETVLRDAIAREDPGSAREGLRVLAEIINLTDPGKRAVDAALDAFVHAMGTPDEDACRLTYARALLFKGLPENALSVMADAMKVGASPEEIAARSEKRCWITHAMVQWHIDGTVPSPDLLHRIGRSIPAADTIELVQLTELCAQTEQFELAKAAVDELIGLGAGWPDTWRLRGSPLARPLERLDWWKAPTVAREDATAVKPPPTDANNRLALIAKRQGLLIKAAATSNRSGGDTAVIQALTGRIAEAERTLRSLAQNNPNSTNCRQLLAELLFNKGELIEAATVANDALNFARNTQREIPCRRTFARICMAQGRADIGMEVLTGRDGTPAVKQARGKERCWITFTMLQAALGVPPDASTINRIRQHVERPEGRHRELAELCAQLNMPELAYTALLNLQRYHTHYGAWSLPGSPLVQSLRPHPQCAAVLQDLDAGKAAGVEITPGAQERVNEDEGSWPLRSTGLVQSPSRPGNPLRQ